MKNHTHRNIGIESRKSKNFRPEKLLRNGG